VNTITVPMSKDGPRVRKILRRFGARMADGTIISLVVIEVEKDEYHRLIQGWRYSATEPRTGHCVGLGESIASAIKDAREVFRAKTAAQFDAAVRKAKETSA
jgi:hypothetical protein